MTLNKCKKLYTTQHMSAFIIYDSLAFKNVASHSPLDIKHFIQTEIVNDSLIMLNNKHLNHLLGEPDAVLGEFGALRTKCTEETVSQWAQASNVG